MTLKHPRLHRAFGAAITGYEAYFTFVDWMAFAVRFSVLAIPVALAYGYFGDGAKVTDFLSQCERLLEIASPVVKDHKLLTAVALAAAFLLVRPWTLAPGIYAATVAAANLGAGHWGLGLGGLLLAVVLIFVLAGGFGLLYEKLIEPMIHAIGEWLHSRHQWASGEGATPAALIQRPRAQVQRQDEPTGEHDKSTLAFAASRPRLKFNDLSGMSDVKGRLLEAGRAALQSGIQSTNGILLYSRPGNGKTVLSEALAGELGIGFIAVSIADIGSKWVGQTTEQLVQAFRDAEQQAPCVLLIDEVDSIISDRNGGSSNDEAQRTTNAFLTEAVRVRGRGVVLIAATNFLDRLDAAAIREGRFDYKIEVPPPDLAARIGLLAGALQREAPSSVVAPSEIEAVARRWAGFSVARLMAIARQVGKTRSSAPQGQGVDRHDLVRALKEIQAQRSTLPEATKRLDALALDPDHADTLHGIAWRMKEIFGAEEAGATVPDGVLFFGPPGTGKTEAVRSLAKETGWALLITSGTELVHNPARIAEIHAQAEDARPAIVFIDEADDILADRQSSGTRAATNKLLTVMDGAHGKTPDVLYIAATNHPGMLDPAVLRGGRFTEKVGFAPPEGDALLAFVQDWLEQKGWTVAGGAEQAVSVVRGLSIANVRAVLQAAVNYRVNRSVRSQQVLVKVLDAEALDIGLAMVAPNGDLA